jgi:AcrR family transcriptional regulator
LVRLEVAGVIVGLKGLAERASVSRATVTRFFAGKSHSADVAGRILEALDLKMSDVLTVIEGDD